MLTEFWLENVKVRGYRYRRPRCRWVCNIKVVHRETSCESVDCFEQGQYRIKWQIVVNAVTPFQVVQNKTFLTSWITVSCSRRSRHHGISWSHHTDVLEV